MFLRDQDAPAMMPWNLVVKYDPDQPRDDDGKWTDGGGGDSAAIASNIMAVSRAQKKIRRSVETYEGYGGVTERLAPEDLSAAAAELEALEAAASSQAEWFPADYDPMRFGFTAGAIESGSQPDMRVYMGRDSQTDNLITGAMSVNTGEPGLWTIVSAGATGVLPGSGSAIFADIVRDAAAAGVGLYLTSSDEGIKFWRSVGMTLSDFQEFNATPQRVRDIAEAI